MAPDKSGAPLGAGTNRVTPSGVNYPTCMVARLWKALQCDGHHCWPTMLCLTWVRLVRGKLCVKLTKFFGNLIHVGTKRLRDGLCLVASHLSQIRIAHSIIGVAQFV